MLDQIRANGEKKELVDEVVTLAKRYGITTPYTSYLVVPDGPLPPVRPIAGRPPVFRAPAALERNGGKGPAKVADMVKEIAAGGKGAGQARGEFEGKNLEKLADE